MNRRMYGRMDGWILIYMLPAFTNTWHTECSGAGRGVPPAGGRIRSQGNYCLPPAGILHSQNKVIKCAAYGVAQARGGGMVSLI